MVKDGLNFGHLRLLGPIATSKKVGMAMATIFPNRPLSHLIYKRTS
jgi:hypothetical protein